MVGIRTGVSAGCVIRGGVAGGDRIGVVGTGRAPGGGCTCVVSTGGAVNEGDCSGVVSTGGTTGGACTCVMSTEGAVTEGDCNGVVSKGGVAGDACTCAVTTEAAVTGGDRIGAVSTGDEVIELDICNKGGAAAEIDIGAGGFAGLSAGGCCASTFACMVAITRKSSAPAVAVRALG